MRAVLDSNVLISGLLSPSGAPAEVLRRWEQGAFELVLSRWLLDELKRALGYPKLRRRIPEDQAAAFLRWLEASGTLTLDPEQTSSVRSEDPGDDYLIALAAGERALLVSGDRHLLALADRIPVVSAQDFLRKLNPG